MGEQTVGAEEDARKLEADVKLRFTSAEEAATLRHEAVMAAIAVSHASIMRAFLERSRR
jgi:hypothetical protein